jgi:acetyl-CoA carboxylase carboxyl transferase subunit alpha
LAKKNFLDFEQPIAELESKIEELRYVQTESAVDISEEIDQLSKKSLQLTKDIYSDLTPWQITKIARHTERPYTLDYVRECFTDFVEMHGDRHFADDQSIIGGLARFNGQPCMVIGHQKGRDTKERTLRNFGMTRPEGYRKALRLMKTAEKFGCPCSPLWTRPAPSRYRRRGARPVRSHRSQHLRDGPAADPSSPPSSVKVARAVRWPLPWLTRC